jgi:hypothetical protein
MLECVVLGWSYRIGRLREHANELSDWKIGRWWDAIIRYFAPIILSALFIWSLLEKASATGGFIHDAADDLNWPVIVGLLFAVLAPALSVALSMIHSPGADTHAAYRHDQPRSGRGAGVFGLAAAVIALGCIVYSFIAARQVQLSGDDASRKLLAYVVLLMTVAGAGFAVTATIIGAVIVAKAERRRHRPSAFARSAAGLGVIAIGSSAGLAMPMLLALYAKPAAASAAPAGAAAAPPEMTWVSYIVLTAMTTLLVGGLLWCFYRAIKAGGAEAPVQDAEDDEGGR